MSEQAMSEQASKARAIEELSKGVPQSEIKQKNGFDYVSQVYIIHTANRIFGFDGWRSEVVTPPHVVDRFTRSKGGGENIVAVVACTVRVHAIGVFHDGQGMGVAEATVDAFAGNLDKAFKEAETDALKRALVKFGDPFALTLYEKDASARNIVDDRAGSPSFGGGAPSDAASWKARLSKATDKAMFSDEWAKMLSTFPEGKGALSEWAEPFYAQLPDAARSGGNTQRQQAGGGDVATDAELDGRYGDPKVFGDPKRWIEQGGESFKGRAFSECPPDYLDALAEMSDYFAGRETDEKKKGYKLKDAKFARGWARRLRQKQAA